jgi:hypothetical protein
VGQHAGQAQRRLHRDGALHPGHDLDGDRCEPGVDLARGGDPARVVRLDHGGDPVGDQVPGHADDTDRTDGQQWQGQRVLTGVVGQVGAGHDVGGGGEIALGVLVGDDAGMLGQPQQRLRVQGRARPPGDVVGHHRQAGCIGDGTEVGQQTVLGRLGVVGGHDEQAMGARLLGGVGQLDGVPGVVGADPGDDPGPVADRAQHHPQQRLLLRVGGGARLPGGAVDDEPVVAAVDQVGGEGGGGIEIQCAVGVEGGDHRSERAPEGGGAARGGRGVDPHGLNLPTGRHPCRAP